MQVPAKVAAPVLDNRQRVTPNREKPCREGLARLGSNVAGNRAAELRATLTAFSHIGLSDDPSLGEGKATAAGHRLGFPQNGNRLGREANAVGVALLHTRGPGVPKRLRVRFGDRMQTGLGLRAVCGLHLPDSGASQSPDQAQHVANPDAVVAPRIEQIAAHLNELGPLVGTHHLIGHDVRQSSLTDRFRHRWHLFGCPSAE